MTTIHILGDSIVTAYGEDSNNFIGGWSDHLPSFFDSNNTSIKVYARGGRSSRSFLNEGRFIDYGIVTPDGYPHNWGPACNQIKPGDYVLMQFSHNDDSSKEKATYVDRLTPLGVPDNNGIYPTVTPTEDMKVSTNELPAEYISVLKNDGYSEDRIKEYIKKYEDILPKYGKKYWSYNCGATYKGYLKFYVDKIRELKATPIIVTAPARQLFKDGKIAAVNWQHGGCDNFGDFPYIRAARQLAAEENVTVLELFDNSKKLFEMLGQKDSRYLQSIKDNNGTVLGNAAEGQPMKWVEEFDKYWRDKLFADIDNTHQNRFGSYLFAAFLAEQIYDKIPELKKFLLGTSTKTMKYPELIAPRISEIKTLYKNVSLNI